MNTTSVSKEIKKALGNDQDKMNPTIEGCEADAIIAAAEADGKVTNAEAKKIADAYESALGPNADSPNPSGCLYQGPIMDTEAKSKLDGFFAKYSVPAGANVPTLKEKLSEQVSHGELGEQLKKAPNVKGFFRVYLDNLQRQDGPTYAAHVNVQKGTFFIELHPGFFAPPGAAKEPRWYGPMKLAGNGPTPLTQARVDAMLEQLETADFNPKTKLPLGVTFATVTLRDNSPFDGLKYEVLVPTGALAPNATKLKDLNKAQQYYLSATNPRTRTPSYAGPFKMPQTDNGGIIPPYILARMKASKAIQEQFQAQFPAHYTSMLEIDTSTMLVAQQADGSFTSTFKADEYRGMFIGTSKIGERHFTAKYDPTTGHVTFAQEAAN